MSCGPSPWAGHRLGRGKAPLRAPPPHAVPPAPPRPPRAVTKIKRRFNSPNTELPPRRGGAGRRVPLAAALPPLRTHTHAPHAPHRRPRHSKGGPWSGAGTGGRPYSPCVFSSSGSAGGSGGGAAAGGSPRSTARRSAMLRARGHSASSYSRAASAAPSSGPAQNTCGGRRGRGRPRAPTSDPPRPERGAAATPPCGHP